MNTTSPDAADGQGTTVAIAVLANIISALVLFGIACSVEVSAAHHVQYRQYSTSAGAHGVLAGKVVVMATVETDQ